MTTENEWKALEMSIVRPQTVPISMELLDWLRENAEQYPYVQIGRWIAKVHPPAGENPPVLDVFSGWCAVQARELCADVDPGQGKTTLKVRYHNGVGLREDSFKKKELFSREGLLRLGDAGLVFQPGAGMQELQRWLVYSESMANVNVSHVNLGWGTDGAFRTFRAFMGDEVNALESDYAGELSVKPTGSLEAWLDMVREHVLGHTPLTAMLLSAFAAPLLPLISKDADLGSLIFSLCSPTSKGKTTAQMLAVSVFGDPNMDASFLYSFDGTDNALLQAAVSGNGLVLAFDDAVSASDRKNWKTFLYNICVGVDKKRLDGELRMKRQTRHTNVLLLSSEYPLVQRSDDAGLRARVFEVSDPLCLSAEQSLAIKAAALKNYACAGEAYAQHVVHLEHEQLMKDYKRCTDILIQVSGAAGKSDIGGRACTKLSTILLAAEEFNTCFANTGCAVDIKALVKFLAALVKDSDRGKDDKGMVLHALMEDIFTHRSSYAASAPMRNGNLWGRIQQSSGVITISILPGRLEELMNRCGLLHRQTGILKQLREDGVLLCEKGRLTTKIQLASGSVGVRGYKFRFSENDYERAYMDYVYDQTESSPTEHLDHGSNDWQKDQQGELQGLPGAAPGSGRPLRRKLKFTGCK